jgi:hypothetical protein
MPESSSERNALNWPVIATILSVLFVACGLIYGLSQNAMLTLSGGIGVGLTLAIGWWLGAETTKTLFE